MLTIVKSKFDHRFHASVGNFEGIGETKTEAHDRLIALIELQSHFMYRQWTIGTVEGDVLHLSYRNGWEYSIMREGSNISPSCQMGTQDFEEARESMRNHAVNFGGIAWQHS